MQDFSQDTNDLKLPEKLLNRRVHMANERTFLAWIRTSIGIMAFGFVLEKFALFTKQMAFILGEQHIEGISPPSHGWSSIMGVSLVALGAAMSALAYVRYKKVKKQIDTDSYIHSTTINAWLTLAVFGVGILLVVYLFVSH